MVSKMMAVNRPRFRSQVSWGFHNPVNLNVGRGCRERLLHELCGKVLLVVTSRRGRRQLSGDAVLGRLLNMNHVLWVDTITENPGLSDLQAEIDCLRNEVPYDVALAFGGGSAMDAAKSINTALAQECQNATLEELLASPGLHADAHPKRLYTVATTAGTGSEVTPFATVWNHEAKKKLSLAGPAVWPWAAYSDSALTDTVPIDATISTGLDAINQAAESIWNKNANSITLGYATRALQLGLSALPKLAEGKGGAHERDQMTETSVLAGLAISHTRTALCHSISYPLTAHFGVPHGLACAFSMPEVLRHNLKGEDGRFGDLAYALTGSYSLDSLVESFERLHARLGVAHRVKSWVPNLDALLAVKNEMFTLGRSENNLVHLSDLEEILRSSWNR